MKYQFTPYQSNEIIYLFSNSEEIPSIQTNVVFLEVENWFDDLSPWPSGQFKGNGNRTLEELKKIIESVEQGKNFEKRYLGGYSLAGLFSLYAYSELDCFNGCFSCSGSLWYPGFMDYIKNKITSKGKIYLSLGEKEELTKNQEMKSVGNNTRELFKLLKEQNIECRYDVNPGGHFNHPEQRLLKGIQWILEEKE